MKLKVLSIALAMGTLALVSCNSRPSKNVTLKTTLDSVSYAIGANFGTNLKRNNLDKIDAKVMLAAMQAAIDGDSLKFDPQEGGMIINNYMRQLAEEKGKENLAKGEKFLSENAKKEGVKTTASGLQYKVIKEGKGAKPIATDEVKVHYEGRLIDGKVFDSSIKRGTPTVFPVNRVIPGWTEALQLMPVGSKYELYIPAKLAYGMRGAGNDIGPNETLIFTVELLDILKPKTKKK